MSEHWYDKQGNPCHTQPTKTAKAKNPTRPTNITDAKKLGLLPSVSGITRMLAAPGLVSWQLGEVAGACFDNPPHPGEDRKEYARSMVEKSKEGVGEAADLGSAIHKSIELYLCGLQHDPAYDGYVLPAIARMKEMGLTVQHSEKVLVNRFDGYAGTTDVIWSTDSHKGILDFKSKRTKPGVPVTPSETHPMQIAAYLAAYFKEEKDAPPFGQHVWGHNLYISTTEPGRVEVVTYSYRQMLEAWEDFLACARLWRSVNGYDPRENT